MLVQQNLLPASLYAEKGLISFCHGSLLESDKQKGSEILIQGFLNPFDLKKIKK